MNFGYKDDDSDIGDDHGDEIEVLLQHISESKEELPNGKEAVFPSRQQCFNGYALKCAPLRKGNDEEAVLATCKHHERELRHACIEPRNNIAVVVATCREDWTAFCSASERFQNGNEVILEVCEQDWCRLALEFAEPELRNDQDFVLELWKYALLVASSELKNDEEEALEVCGHNMDAFLNESPRFLDEKEAVAAACEQNGCASWVASSVSQNDKGVVHVNCNQARWECFLNASETAKRYKEFVFEIKFSTHLNSCSDLLNLIKTSTCHQVIFESIIALCNSSLSSIGNYDNDKNTSLLWLSLFLHCVRLQPDLCLHHGASNIGSGSVFDSADSILDSRKRIHNNNYANTISPNNGKRIKKTNY